MDFSLLQEHTIRLYDLENHSYAIQKVKARSLLSVHRFDLFAKLYYAHYRKEEPELAKEVYLKHIKAFNPDGREPGRSDKVSFDDFVIVYDELLDHFSNHEFDTSKSIVPVSSDGMILDGAHRVAALAYYDKDITIAKFEGVIPVCQFNYQYFKQRGLPQDISDIITMEILQWTPNCLVACMWPRMGSEGQKVHSVQTLSRFSTPFYHKSMEVNLSSLTLFIARVYQKQSWVGTEADHFAGAKDKALNCYSKGNRLDLFFFTSDKSLDEVLELKDQIRAMYPYGKHSIHITDNNEETKDISFFALTRQGQNQWLYTGSWKGWELVKQNIKEHIYIFQHTYWINMKVWIAKKIGL
jgi:hypothetical protein